MFMHSHAYLLSFQYIFKYILLLGTFLIVSFSLSLSSVCVSLLLWHLNANLLCLGTLFVPGHSPLLILLPLTSDSVMRRPNQTFLTTFLDKAFILNAESSCWTSPTLTYLLSFTVGVGSHCVTSWSLVHPC